MTKHFLKDASCLRHVRIFLIFLLLFSCADTMSKYEPNNDIVYPDMVQENYSHFIYKNNRQYLTTVIQYAEFFEKEDRISCKILDAKVYNSKGEITTHIQSDQGEINQKQKLIEFNGSVVIESFENETVLRTENLILDYKNNKMYNNTSVIIERENGSKLEASSMRADIQTQESNYTDMHIIYYYDSDEKNAADDDE